MRGLGAFCICVIFAASLWGGIGRAGQSAEAFAWRGRLEPGKTLLLRNLNGPIVVEAAAGDEAEVTAGVGFEKSSPKDIRFEQRTDARGVQICAAWPGQASCFDGAGGKVADNDLQVTFRVKLPRGAGLDAGTVNGELAVRGVAGAARLATVNGGVEVGAAAAPLTVGTVNGSIHARLVGLAGVGDLHFATVNGDVNVQLPAHADAEVAARTVSGTISILGTSYREKARTTLGKGGRQLSAQTVNGSIAFR